MYCHTRIVALVGIGLLGIFVGSAHAVDGVVLIDQNRALAGGVTPADRPGFPVTISVSGSFRLSSDLVVPPNTSGIEITDNPGDPNGLTRDPNFDASVTIDLNGFAIVGPRACSTGPATAVPGCHGIVSLSQVNGSLIVRSGAIRGMGGAAIWAAGRVGEFDSSKVAIVDHVHMFDNGASAVLGTASLLNCEVHGGVIRVFKGLIRGSVTADAHIQATDGPLIVLGNVILNGQVAFQSPRGAYGANLFFGQQRPILFPASGPLDPGPTQVSINACSGQECTHTPAQ